MRRHRMTTEELDSLARDARPGDVWWCDGRTLRLGDGDKVRPVLVIGTDGAEVTVVPLTTRKPQSSAQPVSHRAGTSWLTQDRLTISAAALLSPLGSWSGFSLWKRSQ